MAASLLRRQRHLFIHFADQQVYCKKGSSVVALTKELNTRFADLTIDQKRGHSWIT
jgi:hypothetical protein